MADQILEISEIPPSIWDPDTNLGEKTPTGVLTLPEVLANAYAETLDELDLMDKAQDLENREEGAIGGISGEESRDHFAQNFSGSCGRTQLFCLDPHQTFKTTRDAMVSMFSGGYITILDIPSGAGSGTATLFSLIAQLRKEGVLPRVDLDIRVVGGDISPTSCEIADTLFSKMYDEWITYGLHVEYLFMEWDVTSDESTGDLVAAWTNTLNKRKGLLLGNNFSGFLGNRIEESKPRLWIEEVESQIRQILTTVSLHGFSAFWLEPANNIAKKKFLPKLAKIFGKYKRIAPLFDDQRSSSAELRDPIVSDGHFAVRATGSHLEPTK